MLYQVCILNKATDEKKTSVKSTHIVTANTLAEATAQVEGKHDNASLRVYPYCTPTDGEGQLALAQHTLRSVENWERRNNNAVMNPLNRTAEDREDYIMVACVAFSAVFAENPNADMHTLKTTAFSAIRTEQAKRDRNSEREYLPGWIACNVTQREARATFPELDRLTKRAVESADMTENQARVLSMAYQDGRTAQDIADELSIKRATVYQTLYRAYYKVLVRMVELDSDLHAFTEAGYTAEDIDEMQATLRKRARW